MSIPGIVLDTVTHEGVQNRMIFNNLILQNEEMISIINCYKPLMCSFSDQNLIGPLPGKKRSDIQLLVYTIPKDLLVNTNLPISMLKFFNISPDSLFNCRFSIQF